MNTENKKEQLLKFVKVLKENGFKVYAPIDLTTYCHFVKDDKIGYMECSDYGFNFSTVHKPNSKCGTGYSIHREVYNPTVKMAEDCFVFAPSWAYPSDCNAIIKYKNWNEYINYSINKWQTQIELVTINEIQEEAEPQKPESKLQTEIIGDVKYLEKQYDYNTKGFGVGDHIEVEGKGGTIEDIEQGKPSWYPDVLVKIRWDDGGRGVEYLHSLQLSANKLSKQRNDCLPRGMGHVST